jgi:hypothetical protein
VTTPGTVTPQLMAGLEVQVRREVLVGEEVRQLLHTEVISGRARAALWDLANSATKSVFSKDIHDRMNGRVDRELSGAWARAARQQLPSFAKVEAAIADMSRKGSGYGRMQIAWHVMTVHPGALLQEWHRDAPHKKGYKTFIIALTQDPAGSGTEFPVKQAGGEERTVVINQYGGVVAFTGGASHRGTAHTHTCARVFLYAAMFCGDDPNTHAGVRSDTRQQQGRGRRRKRGDVQGEQRAGGDPRWERGRQLEQQEQVKQVCGGGAEAGGWLAQRQDEWRQLRSRFRLRRQRLNREQSDGRQGWVGYGSDSRATETEREVRGGRIGQKRGHEGEGDAEVRMKGGEAGGSGRRARK